MSQVCVPQACIAQACISQASISRRHVPELCPQPISCPIMSLRWKGLPMICHFRKVRSTSRAHSAAAAHVAICVAFSWHRYSFVRGRNMKSESSCFSSLCDPFFLSVSSDNRFRGGRDTSSRLIRWSWLLSSLLCVNWPAVLGVFSLAYCSFFVFTFGPIMMPNPHRYALPLEMPRLVTLETAPMSTPTHLGRQVSVRTSHLCCIPEVHLNQDGCEQSQA
jgi:hypothetical protein